jgi:hypothetical protein
MNEAMSRLRSDARGPELADALPDLHLVRSEVRLPNTWAKGRPTRQGAFNPGHGCVASLDGPRARRAAAADAMRRWMFDPTPEQFGPCARGAEATQETQVSETA